MTSDATSRRHDVLRAALTLDEQLDDIKRAQIWSQLEDRLAEPVRTRPSWRLPVVALAAAAALALLWLQLRPTHPSVRTLSAPAETTLAASIGPHTRAELVGPAQLELIGPVGDATSVHLTHGTLLAEFTGGPGRSLRIETREAVVEIVGTVFSVEARTGATCVSVAHGNVRVTTHTGTLAVSGGQTWCSTEPAVTPIEPAAHDHLDRFEAVITARAATSAPVVVAAQPPVAEPPAVMAEQPPVAAPPPAAAPAVVVAEQPPRVAVPARHLDGSSTVPSIATRTDDRTNASKNESWEEPAAGAPSDGPAAAAPAPRPQPTQAPTSSRAAGMTSSPAAGTTSAPAPGTESSPAAGTTSSPAPVTAPAPAPVTAPPPPPAPVAAPPTPESLYEAAETALARRDAAGADRILAKLLTDFPHASLADQALLERARIAYDRHAWRDAQQDLDQLAAIASTPLAEPGAYLACRIALAAHDGAAEHCLTEFRKAYPKSAHDLDVLGVLTDLAYQAGGCTRARPRIDELVRAYSHTTLAHAWVGRCSEGP